MTFDREFWEQRWDQAVREHPEAISGKPPLGLLTEVAQDPPPGRALDAGCGHGSESLWLAAHGWTVTGVDFSTTALALAAERAQALGVAVDWVEADLGSWSPAPQAYDLVTSLYVHVSGDVTEMVVRLAAGVAPGGTLLMVGHAPFDASGHPSPAAGQNQVTVEEARAALEGWEILVAEQRDRDAGGVDAVILAIAPHVV